MNTTNIKLDKLRSFILVAEESNLTRAARRRHSTPSAVSEHLRQLEDEFGVSLFQRTTQGMKLTRAGEALLIPAQRALAQVNEMMELARQLRQNSPLSLLVGLNALPEYLKVDQLIQQAATVMPEVSLELRTSSSPLIAEQVSTGKMDLGFVYGEWPDERLHCEYLAPVQICVVGPPADAKTGLPDSKEERLKLPWIWPSDTCPFFGMMREVLGNQWHQANTVTTSEDEHTTMAMIRAGIGYGLVERSFALGWAQRGAVRLYEEPYLGTNLNLCARHDRMSLATFKRFSELVQSLWQVE